MDEKELAAINKRLADLQTSSSDEVEKLIVKVERELKSNYSAALDDIKKMLALIYEKYAGEDGIIKYGDMLSYNRLKNLIDEINKNIKSLSGTNTNTITSGLKEFFAQSFYRTGYSLEQGTGLKLGFGLLDPLVIRAAVLNPVDRIKWQSYPERIQANSQLYAQRIKNNVTQGLIKGFGYAKMARGVTDQTTIDFNRSIRITRTEGHRSQSAGRLMGFDKTIAAAERLGLKTARVWVSTLDLRTRPTPEQRREMEKEGYVADHRWMDGKEAKYDPDSGLYLFTFKEGTTTQGPGLSGIPEEDINCRCTTMMQIEGFTPKFRRETLTNNVISYKNYEEWYNERIKKAA